MFSDLFFAFLDILDFAFMDLILLSRIPLKKKAIDTSTPKFCSMPFPPMGKELLHPGIGAILILNCLVCNKVVM
jgi:hypothetical protein